MNKKILCLLSFVCLASILSCQKESNDNKENYSIDLYGKSPDEIQPYIQGKWKLEYYVYGGIVIHKEYVTDISYWTFTDNHITIIENGIQTTNTTFSWQQFDGINLYVMVGNGQFSEYCVEGITNDTLNLAIPVTNGTSIGLSKVKH